MQNMNSGLSFEASVVKSTNRFAALDLVENSQEDHESSYNDENAARGHVRKHLLQIIDRGSAVAPKEQSKKVGAENDPYQLKEHPISGRHMQVVDERIRNDSLCSACQSILDPHQVFDQLGLYGVTDTDKQILHKEYRSFDSAVCAGCYICSLLKQKLEFKFLVKDPDTRLEENKKIESDFQSLHYKISQEEFDLRLTFQYSGRNGIITRSDILQLKMCYVSDIENVLHPIHITNWVRSKRGMELIQYWLHQCQSKHTNCSPIWNLSDRKLPTRLIEIESVRGKDVTHLRDGNTLPSSTHYLTLSHCWGRERIFTLLGSNFESFYQNIDRAKLPKTFQDALWMTRRLGFKYLWIDSLCIIQDSHDDWLKEAPQMGEVYRNAAFNLAATGFSDGRKGLFSTRESRLLLPLKVYADWDGILGNCTTQRRGQYYLMDENLWEDGVSNAPLNRRAWVVQERILSPRIIHFGAQQLFWECYELKASEAFPNGFNHQIVTGEELKNEYFRDSGSFRSPETSCSKRPNTQLPSQLCSKIPDRKKLYSFWRTVVQAYSSCHLTFGLDKLPAISGIAKQLWLPLKERYVAGLWEGDLIHSLVWVVLGSDDFYGLPSKYRAPTWSWASLDAKINYWYASVTTRPSYISEDQWDHPPEVIHSSIVDVTSAVFMNDDNEQLTIHWSLQIKGPLRRAVKIPFHGSYGHLLLISWEVNGKVMNLQVSQDTKPGFNGDINRPYALPSRESITGAPFTRDLELSLLSREVDEIFILPIRSDWEDLDYFRVEMYGLVLCPTRRRRGEFYRIGTFINGDLESQKVVLQHVDAYEERFFEGVDSAGDYTISIV